MKAFPVLKRDLVPVPTIERKPIFLKPLDPISWHRRCMKWHERRCWAFHGEEFKYHYFAYRWHAKRYQSLVS